MTKSNESNDKRIARTQSNLKKALIELCQSKNSDNISISELVDKAGYSRGAFYNNYETREDFLKRFVDDEAETFSHVAREMATGELGRDYTLKMYRHVYENKDLYIILLSGSISGYTIEYFTEKVTDILANEYKVNFSANNDIIDQHMFHFLNVHHYIDIIKFWMSENFKYSPEYISEQEYYQRETRVIGIERNNG